MYIFLGISTIVNSFDNGYKILDIFLMSMAIIGYSCKNLPMQGIRTGVSGHVVTTDVLCKLRSINSTRFGMITSSIYAYKSQLQTPTSTEVELSNGA
jgi:hypothetical protein